MSKSYLVTSGWAEKLTLCFILIGLVAFARSIYDSLEEVGPAFLRIVGIVLLCLAIPALLCWGALALANSWARTISGLLLVLLLLTPALWLGWRMALTVSLARTKDLPTPTFSDIHF